MSRISTKKRLFQQVVADIRECVYSVVRHRPLPNGQNMATAIGSGFFVSPNLFFTCYHVLNTVHAPHQPGDWYHLVSNLGQTGTVVTVQPAEIGNNIHLFPEKDAALIQVASPPAQQKYVVVDYGQTPVGLEIGVAGYPLAAPRAVNGVLHYDGLVYRVAKGVVTSELRENIQTMSGDPLIREVNTIEVNFLFVSGNSGGPIFESETGRVYAFVHGFRNTKIAERFVDSTPQTIANGAPPRHIESVHAIYSVGIRMSNVRAELQNLGATL